MFYKYIVYLMIMLKYNIDFVVIQYNDYFIGEEKRICVDWFYFFGCFKEDFFCY